MLSEENVEILAHVRLYSLSFCIRHVQQIITFLVPHLTGYYIQSMGVNAHWDDVKCLQLQVREIQGANIDFLKLEGLQPPFFHFQCLCLHTYTHSYCTYKIKENFEINLKILCYAGLIKLQSIQMASSEYHVLANYVVSQYYKLCSQLPLFSICSQLILVLS